MPELITRPSDLFKKAELVGIGTTQLIFIHADETYSLSGGIRIAQETIWMTSVELTSKDAALQAWEEYDDNGEHELEPCMHVHGRAKALVVLTEGSYSY